VVVLYVYSTIASLQSSVSELNTAYIQLKESVVEEQTKLADYDAQVTTLSSQLRDKVTVSFVHVTCCNNNNNNNNNSKQICILP